MSGVPQMSKIVEGEPYRHDRRWIVYLTRPDMNRRLYYGGCEDGKIANVNDWSFDSRRARPLDKVGLLTLLDTIKDALAACWYKHFVEEIPHD